MELKAYAKQLGRRNLSPDAFKLALGRRYNRTKKTKAEAGAIGGSSKDQIDICLPINTAAIPNNPAGWWLSEKLDGVSRDTVDKAMANQRGHGGTAPGTLKQKMASTCITNLLNRVALGGFRQQRGKPSKPARMPWW